MFTLKIETDNAAFGDQDGKGDNISEDCFAEVARILRKTADRVEREAVSGPLMDVNGNKVGEFSF